MPIRNGEPAGVCAERERLLHIATLAVVMHDQIVSELAKAAAGGNFATLARRGFEESASFHDAQTAWDEYRKHVEAHNCWTCSPEPFDDQDKPLHS